MRTWRRDYVDAGVGTVIETPHGLVVIYLPRGEEDGVVHVTWSMEQAQALADSLANHPPAPLDWMLERGSRTPEISFLTERDCGTADLMQTRLNEALTSIGLPRTYTVTDRTTLAATDPRRRYGPPTVLVDGSDLFGQPEPSLHHAAPT